MDSEKDLLDKIHKVSLYLLLAFDTICREQGLTYFLDSGTALGAVRHGGFIPWDDDVDVGMPRADYERFLKLGQDAMPEDLFIQTRETDLAYRRNVAKLRLKGTVFQELEDLPYAQNGFFIDIFPFDNVPQNKLMAKLHIFFTGLICRIINSYETRKESVSGFRRAVQTIIKKIPRSFIDRLEKKHLKLCRKYDNTDTGFMTCHHWIMTYAKGNAYLFAADKILPVRDILFEGHPLKIVNDPHYYLNLMYGNYMQLPPENERHGQHWTGQVDFGKYA